jgi:hypothetical protein
MTFGKNIRAIIKISSQQWKRVKMQGKNQKILDEKNHW